MDSFVNAFNQRLLGTLPSLLYLLLFFTIAVGIISLSFLLSTKKDAREPPLIPSRLPFIGHLVGMWQYGPAYYQIINKANYPIYTLPTLNTRNYIVSSPSLVSGVQRNTRTLSFYAVIVEVTRRLCAFDKAGARIILYNLNNDQGPDAPCLMGRTHDMMNAYLSPGPTLDEITSVQLQQMSAALSDVTVKAPFSLNLYTWIQRTFTVCNGYAIYGPSNIFATNPTLERTFWEFENGMLGLVVDFLPWITARKAYLARKKVLEALVEYVKQERYKSASSLIQERIAINQSFGLSPEMVAHGELVMHFGILGNAVPTVFWLVINIYSRPQLLQELRNELEGALDLKAPSISSDKQMETERRTISASIVKSCPLLYSCYRETLRETSNLSSPRLVVSDTMLADKYLLRANSMLQIPAAMLHQDTSIWGADAASFNPERFLVPNESNSATAIKASSHSTKTATLLPKGVPSTAFRSFGGGNTLCPGRHFAQSEIMTFFANFILAFDIETPDGGTIAIPAKNDMTISLAMVKPVKEPVVVIKKRSGWENVLWEMTL